MGCPVCVLLKTRLGACVRSLFYEKLLINESQLPYHVLIFNLYRGCYISLNWVCKSSVFTFRCTEAAAAAAVEYLH